MATSNTNKERHTKKAAAGGSSNSGVKKVTNEEIEEVIDLQDELVEESEDDASVKFINDQVLNVKASFEGSAKVVADQAAAMLLQDMRSFIQGNEQVLTAAVAQVMAKALAGQDKPASDTMKQILAWSAELTKFAGEITTQATQITTEFN